MEETRIIRFDWAIKTLLRDKANFDILEGFLTALLQEEVEVVSLLESESNTKEEQLKYNRVDLLVKDAKDRHLIIEIQNQHETDYLERLLFGASKIIVENLGLGENYEKVQKVISISILFFNLGLGDDYVYYGNTEFRGIHTDDLLRIRHKVKNSDNKTRVQAKKNIFPEYYLIRVEAFQDLIEADLDEWIYMLKHESIKPEFKSKNIHQAGRKLDLLKMPPEERKRYENYVRHTTWERGLINTAKEDGIEEGFEKGIEKGIEQEKMTLVKGMKEKGVDPQMISEISGLSLEEIEKL